MADIDIVLSGSFKRVAEPGDPTGVAELIRSRVAAGDTGTPSDGAVFDKGSGWTWLPWIGAGVVVAIAGAVVGASGVFGSLQPAESAPVPGVPVAVFTSGLDCPGGSAVVAFRPGDRVLAVARSDDSAYLAVRSPFDRSDTVWLPVSAVDIDEGEPDLASLEVDGCPVPVVTVVEPSTPPTTPPVETTKPKPPSNPQPPQPPAPVDNPPTLGTVSISDNTLYQGDITTITATASDDHGVSAVQISWSGADSGSDQMTKVGGQWKFDYTRTANDDGTITFTVRAVDTKNQKSAPKSVNATVYYFG
ncbi:MAG TPA: Ig-like domain-containing protein [Terrimesophilobacter sp.]|nr:Ig-like domain-containing protein [Terrimesophilobacter sp.]